MDVDLAPVLDGRDGPLGSRHFRSQAIGVAFGRGVLEGGAGACAKHFPGLGTTPRSTDEARVEGRARLAVRAGADLLLYTSGRDAARAIRALVPLARADELDEHVARVLRFRRGLR